MFSIRIFFVVLIVSFMSLNPTAKAGIFGPKNYDECITESMKGVDSDVAARAIKASCRKQFPEEKTEKKKPEKKKFSDQQIEKITITDMRFQDWGYRVFVAQIYNGNSESVSYLNINLTAIINGIEKTSIYSSEVGVEGLSSAPVYFRVAPRNFGYPEEKVVSCEIIEAFYLE